MTTPAKPKIHNFWIDTLGIYEPGRPIEEVARELGVASVDDIIKLASNENAHGPAPKAVKAMHAAAERMHLYPDGGAFYLRKALARHHKVAPEQIVVGNGSNELLELLVHIYLREGTSSIMADRAFIVYKLIPLAYRAEVISVPMSNFVHDLDAMLQAVRPDTRIIFIANPNNPTGTMVDRAAVDRFMARLPRDVVVVFDEAYMDLLPPDRQVDTLPYLGRHPHVFILRTFSKSYGLAGLRVGYAITTPENVDLLNKVRQPFNVNAMGLAAAEAALGDQAYVNEYARQVQAGLAYFEQELTAMGLEYVPSVTNFMLVKVGSGRQVFQAMLKERVIVRPVDGYGLPDYVRISLGTPEHNKHCMAALRKVMGR